MANNEQIKRRCLVVDAAFQYGVIAKFCVMVSLAAFVMGGIVFLFCGRTVTTVFLHSRLKVMSTMDFILPGLALAAAIVIAVVGLSAALLALFLSHRIAGPAYRLSKDIALFTDGDLTKVFVLREKDELQTVADRLNETARKLQTDISFLKREVEVLYAEADGAPAIQRRRIETIKTVLDRYHV